MKFGLPAADIRKMERGSRRRWGSQLRRKALWVIAGAVALVVVGAAVNRGQSSQSALTIPAGHGAIGSMGPANRTLPPGEWEATGTRLTGTPGYTNEPAGTVLHRPWTFIRICKRSCRVHFFRQTLYGPSITTLVEIGRNRYTASFPGVRVPCAYPGTYTGDRRPFGESHDRYVLDGDLAGSELRATERQTQSGCYPTEPEPPDVTKWRAVLSG